VGIDRQDLPQGATAASRRAEIDHDAASSVGLRSQGRATAGGVVTPMLAALLWPVPYQPRIMTLRDKLPIGFIVPAQPVEREAPPAGADWVHEIKHDGYRMIVRRDGDSVRLYSRKAIDWTTRLPAIAKGAAVLKAKSFTIDGEAVVVGPDGLTDFEALRRRGAGEVAVL